MIKIKSKKDWCIAFIFTFLIVYGVTTRYSSYLQRMLLNYGNPRLTNMNQPKSYGNLIVTVAIMVLIIEIVLIVYHRSVKVKGITIVAGIVCVGFIFVGYLINCNLIVSVIDSKEPNNIHVGGWANGINIELNKEEQKQLVKYCNTLEPVSKEKEERLEKEFYSSDNNITLSSILIWMAYPEQYGHNYHYMVCVYNNMIFVRKGDDNNMREIVTFFEDNGLVNFIKERKSE